MLSAARNVWMCQPMAGDKATCWKVFAPSTHVTRLKGDRKIPVNASD